LKAATSTATLFQTINQLGVAITLMMAIWMTMKCLFASDDVRVVEVLIQEEMNNEHCDDGLGNKISHDAGVRWLLRRDALYFNMKPHRPEA